MAKSRRKGVEASIEFGNLVDLDAQRREKRRQEGQAKHIEREEAGERAQREALAGMGDKGGEGGGDRGERKKRTRVAALYSDLRESYDRGTTTKEDIRKYLEEFPSRVEREAYERIAEAIKSGEIGGEINELRGGVAREAARDKKRREVKQRIREVVGGRWVERKVRVPVERARPGVVGAPTAEEKAEWSTNEWYRFLLRAYATGRLNETDVRTFLVDFPPEGGEAHKKLLDEIMPEKKPKDKLSREEVEEMLMRGLGVREELIKDIPTEEGKTLFDEMLKNQVEIFRGVILDTVSRADYEAKVQECGGDRAKAEQELVRDTAKKFLAVRELFTHGVMGYSKAKGQIVLNRYSDLDGRCAIALLGKSGLNIKKVGYLTPGEIKQGQLTVDSGNKDGLVTESVETVDPKTGERKQEITTVFDHHGPHSDRETSATKTIYKVFAELGLLKFKDEKGKANYEKVVEWVTQSDNFDFPDMEKYFQTSDRRMIGFLKSRSVTLDTLLRFADSGKEIADELGESDLRKFGLIYKDRKRGVVDRAAERREVIKRTLETVRELSSQGWSVVTKDGKRFLVDTQNKIGGEGQWAAASLGYDGVIRYTPETHNFFVALNKGTFDEKVFAGLPQGKLVRNSVFIKMAGGEKLVVTLGDLLSRLAPNFKPGPKTELKKFLEAEPQRIRAVVSRSPEGWGWTNAPDGRKVIVRSLPRDFKSGQELYIVLREPKEISDEDRRQYGSSDFYWGYSEPEEIILPKKEETKKEPAKPEAKSAKPEIQPPAEKPATPEEARKREAERIMKQALAEERRKLFAEFMGHLEKSPIYGKKSRKELEEMARGQLEIKIKFVEKKLKEKYGL